MQKAFDTVDHKILLDKLFKYGIIGKVHEWFKEQFVNIAGTISDMGKITCGIPQGSTLGPLMFLIYINDIGNSAPGLSIKLFADDTNLFIFSNNVVVFIE